MLTMLLSLLKFVTSGSGIVTVICCACILGYSIFVGMKVWKLKRLAECIKTALQKENPLSSFDNLILQNLAKFYSQTINITVNNQTKTNIPSQVYFSVTRICQGESLNIKLLEASSSIMVGGGILGTFLGLCFGVGSVNLTDAQGIQESIESLVNGMGTAFVTSIVGMLCSIAFTLFEKRYRNALNSALSELTERLDAEYYIDDISLSNYNQEKNMTLLCNSLQTAINSGYNSLNDTIKSQTTVVDASGNSVSMATAVNASLNKIIAQNDEQTITLNKITAQNDEQTITLNNLSKDVASELNSEFREILSTQLQEQIIPMMSSLNETTNRVIDQVDAMALMITAPATEMIKQIVADLHKSVDEMIAGFKEGVLLAANNEIEKLVQSIQISTELLNKFPEELKNVQENVSQSMSSVKDSVIELVDNVSDSGNKLIVATTSHIDESILKMQASTSQIQEALSQSVQDMKEAMVSGTNETKTILLEVAETSANTSQKLIESVADTTKNFVVETTEVLGEGVAKMQSTTTHIQETITQCGDGMYDMVIAATNESKNIMQNLADTTTKASERLIASVLETTDVLSASSEKITTTVEKSVDKISESNEILSDTIEIAHDAFKEISGATNSLGDISTNVMQTAEVFNQSYKEYAVKIEKLDSYLKECMKGLSIQVQNACKDAKYQYDNYETIRQGLESIFQQVQGGLQDYSSAVRESVRSYLDLYTKHLTETTGALASTIQYQNEITETLIEVVNNKKK